MSRERTVMPHKVVGQEYEEAALVAATLPGTLVQISVDTVNGGYKATKNAVRGVAAHVVYENELFGKSVETVIPINERAVCYLLVRGNRFTGIVKAGVAVAVNDILISDVDGLVDKAAAAVVAVEDGTSGVTTTWPVVAERNSAQLVFLAEEACAANATGDDRRIKLRVL